MTLAFCGQYFYLSCQWFHLLRCDRQTRNLRAGDNSGNFPYLFLNTFVEEVHLAIRDECNRRPHESLFGPLRNPNPGQGRAGNRFLRCVPIGLLRPNARRNDRGPLPRGPPGNIPSRCTIARATAGSAHVSRGGHRPSSTAAADSSSLSTRSKSWVLEGAAWTSLRATLPPRTLGILA